jgi:NADP-dependent 3-hydroxy acid dehydrogenase YdfG
MPHQRAYLINAAIPYARQQKGEVMSKTWFITGASAGLGRLMTERLLSRSDRVAGSVRRADALDDLKGQHPVSGGRRIRSDGQDRRGRQ